MRDVTVKLINHGGYDGMKHLAFPIIVKGRVHDKLAYIDVPMSELERIGYDKVAGQVSEYPDCNINDDALSFFKGIEAEIVE